MRTFDLPDHTIEFLKSGSQLIYDYNHVEAGEVKLKRLDQLTEEAVWIGTEMEEDPHFGEDGYYRISAVSLTGECKNYNPQFILLWLPKEKMFGTWDCDHWILKVFRDTDWSHILANPAAYLNAQWDVYDKLAVPFVPWPKYEFKKGRPF